MQRMSFGHNSAVDVQFLQDFPMTPQKSDSNDVWEPQISNFENSKWRMIAILRIVISPYFIYTVFGKTLTFSSIFLKIDLHI